MNNPQDRIEECNLEILEIVARLFDATEQFDIDEILSELMTIEQRKRDIIDGDDYGQT